ncbi:SusC/RagA family TonB-linked outer membrane protein [Aquimarina sp. LLG6339-5]|uniref:SusC/RagA family TonB-linked outer membrane protein n=1 Tax=Aquimarina sp. LLG6339-5 TaxID=3160830 RepID=UPI003870DCCB
MRNILLYLFVIATHFCVAQENTVTGKTVNSKNGEPLPFVNIINKAKNTGTTSDFDGVFSIVVENGETLEFSSVGFKTVTMVIKDTAFLDVQMDEDVAELESVVVIGYGTQRKKEITGSVSIVGDDVVSELQPQIATEALRGTVAGVEVSQQGGNPGAAFNINIRGISSNSNNRPDIYVDGALTDFNNINPDDIETFTVLKDAQAAIYGSTAANGVILITTKAGRRGQKPKLSYSNYYGFQQVTKKINVLNATEYALVQNEKFVNGGDPIRFTNIASLGRGTDWQEEIFNTAAVFNHALSIRGGGEKYTYLLSGAHLEQEGAIGGSKARYQRDNVRLKSDIFLSETFKVRTDINYLYTENGGIFANGLGSVTFNALNSEPTIPLRDDNGVLSLGSAESSNEVFNPVTQIENTFNEFSQNRFSGFLNLEYDIIQNLELNGRLNITHQSGKQRSFTPSFVYGPGKTANVDPGENTVFEQIDNNNNYVFDYFATYSNTFAENHDVTLTAGGSAQRFWGFGFNGVAFDIPFNSFDFAILSNGRPFSPSIDDDERPNPDNLFGRFEYANTRSSLFGRFQYGFNGKYLLSAVFRNDRSSLFAPGFESADFFGITAGWVVSDESFMENTGITLLKIRGSYGELGNDKALETRQGVFNFDLQGEGEFPINGGNTIIRGAAPGSLGNPFLKWEVAKQLDVGFDLQLLDGRFNFVFDYFIKDTENQIVDVDVSGILGGGTAGAVVAPQNVGDIRNKGMEFSADYSFNIGKLEIGLGANLTVIDNEVTKVIGGEFIEQSGFRLGQAAARFQEGLPVGSFYGLQTAGIFQTQEEIDNHATYNLGATPAPGDLIFVDTNNDGVVDNDDRTYLGDPLGDFTYGINLSLQYKGIDFSIRGFGSQGNELLRSYERDNPFVNQLDYVLGRWTGPGTSNEIPRLTTETTNNGLLSTFFVEDASYFRINNIQLGYSIPVDPFKSIGLEKLRIYMLATNPFTFTEYRGYDPAAQTGNIITRGIDNGFYPAVSTYSMGVNVNF